MMSHSEDEKYCIETLCKGENRSDHICGEDVVVGGKRKRSSHDVKIVDGIIEHAREKIAEQIDVAIVVNFAIPMNIRAIKRTFSKNAVK